MFRMKFAIMTSDSIAVAPRKASSSISCIPLLRKFKLVYWMLLLGSSLFLAGWLASGLRHSVRDDVGVTRVGDAKAAHSEVLPTGGSEVNVVARVMVHACRQHSIILNLRFLERRAVVSNDHQEDSSLAKRLQCAAIAEGVLPALHHQR